MDDESVEQRLDPRVRRTRKWLHDALIALLQEKSYTNISITDLTKEADLARVTFYQHFESKEALLLSAVEEFFSQSYDGFDVATFWEFVERGTLETAAGVNSARLISPTQRLLMLVALQEIGPAVRALVVRSFIQRGSERGVIDEAQLQILATYHVGGVLALLEQALQQDEQGLPDHVRIIMIIFLRAVIVEAVQNGLLDEALSST